MRSALRKSVHARSPDRVVPTDSVVDGSQVQFASLRVRIVIVFRDGVFDDSANEPVRDDDLVSGGTPDPVAEIDQCLVVSQAAPDARAAATSRPKDDRDIPVIAPRAPVVFNITDYDPAASYCFSLPHLRPLNHPGSVSAECRPDLQLVILDELTVRNTNRLQVHEFTSGSKSPLSIPPREPLGITVADEIRFEPVRLAAAVQQSFQQLREREGDDRILSRLADAMLRCVTNE